VSDGPKDGEGSSIWNRLRRRKVVQWTLAYAAGAWGLLQGLQFVVDAFEWPNRVLKLGTVAALLGLPLVVALAWFRGERGYQRATRAELTVVTLLFLLGGGIFWYYQHTAVAPEAQVDAPAATPSPMTPAAFPNDRSIAVLPFVNMSSDEEQEYFSDGISEELLNLLAQIPELRVIARSSSFSFKDKQADIAEIASKLNVAHVLEGSVRRSGDTLRITAQLIRAADSSHLWAQTYDRPMTDVFKLQDEIAAAVVEQLRIKLLGNAPKAMRTDPEAYALFLQGREASRYDAKSIERAIALYTQALAIDPRYAPAWDGLARAYSDQIDTGIVPPAEVLPLARASIRQALASDPGYAPAYARAAYIEGVVEGDVAAGARHVERGLALDPANLDLLEAAVKISRRLDRPELSTALAEYAVKRDPVSVTGRHDLAVAYFFAGRLDDAVAEYRNAINLNTGTGILHEQLGEVLLLKGDTAGALAEIQQESDESFRLIGLVMIHHALGQNAESDFNLDQLIRKYADTQAYSIAYALAFRGESDRAFEWLDKAVEQHDSLVGLIAIDPLLQTLHADPRWQPLMRRLGKSPEQLAAIKFDVKVPD
jgi:TolB-like protein/Tfp pilus assembly protein PilF